MMHFLCMKWGNKYSPEYVNNLYKMVQQNYTKRFKFICYTDEPEGIHKDVKIRSIPNVDPLHPRHWFGQENFCWDRAKFLVLNSHHWLRTKGPFCYLDLDVIIQNNIDEIFELSKTPHMIYSNWENPKVLKDRRFTDMRGTLYNSSVMLWCTDQGEKIYNDVIKHKDTVFKTFWKGTDNYYPYREHQAVGDNYWSFLPNDWVYSYNRGRQHPNDVTQHLYREDAKFCIFEASVGGRNKNNLKPHELRDYNLLTHWHGKTEFERLWLPKFPDNFFDKNKHTNKISQLLRTKDYDTLEEKFLKDLPQLKQDWEQYSKEFETLREWIGFESLTDSMLQENYMDKDTISDIKELIETNDLQSLSEKMINDFPELEEYFKGTISEVKVHVPELEREISDLIFIRQIEPHHKDIIKELYDSGDMISMHKKFLADYPDDPVLLEGDESLYWNKDANEIYDLYKQRYIYKSHLTAFDEAKELGPVRYFWNISFLQCFALYKRLWDKNTLPQIKKDVMDNIKEHGMQRVFWDASTEDVQSLYKKYYLQNLKELFYKEDYEKVFERLYNIMPKQELISIINQDSVKDNDTLVKYFQMHGEQYSDLYTGLYDDGNPEGALIQLSTKQNDTGNEFNDIFVNGKEHTLDSLKTVVENFKLQWVTFMCEITDPTNCDEIESICRYFKEKLGCTVTVQTFKAYIKDLPFVDRVEHVLPTQPTENEIKVNDSIASDIPVSLETLKRFKKDEEVRTKKPKMKEKEPVWCDARKSEYFYVNSQGNLFPCAYIARDVMEHKLFPYHPIDYTYNFKYNDGTKFNIGEIIYNHDFENISQHLKRKPLSVCTRNCGDCHAS